ncbi:MAG: pyridoxamine 5'-phosphate oxidase family protein [Alphaproteobacteria bacterium]|nr:pyridoxamine 5'-phosphate oxidase family protein [Alphaproteobacteria bacterium]
MADGTPEAFIQDEAELRSLHDAVNPLAAQKAIPSLEAHSLRFIELSPFLCIASADPAGPADVSPRGDAPGFVKVLDDHTLLIPDRIGNNRLDTSANITNNPYIGLLFLVPGMNETLRVNGRARLCTDADVLAEFEVRGKVPKTGILVDVEEVLFQCSKALVRSRLWEDDYKVERKAAMPPLGHIIKDQIGSAQSGDELEAYVQKSVRERMY